MLPSILVYYINIINNNYWTLSAMIDFIKNQLQKKVFFSFSLNIHPPNSVIQTNSGATSLNNISRVKIKTNFKYYDYEQQNSIDH